MPPVIVRARTVVAEREARPAGTSNPAAAEHKTKDMLLLHLTAHLLSLFDRITQHFFLLQTTIGFK